MLFGFFLRTNKTFGLVSKSYPLKFLPQLCTNGSKMYSHIISPVSQIKPQTVSLDDNLNIIPIFMAGIINKEGNVVPFSFDSKQPFCLIFYPDPNDPPLTGVSNDLKELVKEYWKNVQPMLICRDKSGFYLGVPNDENIVLFEQCESVQSECYIQRILEGYNESTMQMSRDSKLDKVQISLKKKS